MSKNVQNVLVRTPYNYNRDAASVSSGLLCADPSLARQSMKDECDINNIVRRFGVTGQMPVSVRAPEYGDFSGLSDYHTALNAIASAHESFDALPAEIRRRFNNDPAQLIDFCSNTENRAEAEKLGLVFVSPADLVANDSQQEQPESR